MQAGTEKQGQGGEPGADTGAATATGADCTARISAKCGKRIKWLHPPPSPASPTTTPLPLPLLLLLQLLLHPFQHHLHLSQLLLLIFLPLSLLFLLFLLLLLLLLLSSCLYTLPCLTTGFLLLASIKALGPKPADNGNDCNNGDSFACWPTLCCRNMCPSQFFFLFVFLSVLGLNGRQNLLATERGRDRERERATKRSEAPSKNGNKIWQWKWAKAKKRG